MDSLQELNVYEMRGQLRRIKMKFSCVHISVLHLCAI